MKKDKSYGVEVNMSMIKDEDGSYSMGVHYNDSNGFDADAQGKSKNLSEVFDSVHEDILKSYKKHNEEKKNKLNNENKVNDVDKKIQDLIEQNSTLNKKVSELRKENRYLMNALAEKSEPEREKPIPKVNKKESVSKQEDCFYSAEELFNNILNDYISHGF